MAGRGRGKSTDVLTPLELEIMKVLWDAGPSNVGQVQATLDVNLAYNSVQTMLGVLVRKDRVKRSRGDGRAFLYEAAVSREGATKTALADMVARMFGGSGEALLLALIATRQVTREEIDRASKLIPPEERN